MDDDRLTARLRSLDSLGRGSDVAAPRAEFVEALRGELEGRLEFGGVSVGPRPASRRSGSAPARRWVLIAATVALMIAAAASIAAVGGALERLLERPTLIDSIQSSGSIRVAIRPDSPQVASSNGVLSGFDIDVAEVLGQRLGVGIERAVQPVEVTLAPGDPEWQLAFPSRALSVDEAGRYVATKPYYRWPVYVVVRRSEAGGFDLAGAALCVVTGSPGEVWARSESGAGSVAAASDDDACLAEVRDGRADAMATRDLLAIDLRGDSELAVLGEGAVTDEPRAVLIPAGLHGSEALAAVIDAELAEMRADGTLAELSKRRFGGEDLTQP
jgi:cystine transport system substrate-binding protein